jgi:hypothetical protein
MDVSMSGGKPMLGSREHGNEQSDFIKDQVFLD